MSLPILAEADVLQALAEQPVARTKRPSRRELSTSHLVPGSGLWDLAWRVNGMSVYPNTLVVLVDCNLGVLAELQGIFLQNGWRLGVLTNQVVLAPDSAGLIRLARLLHGGCNDEKTRNRVFRLLAVTVRQLQLLLLGRELDAMPILHRAIESLRQMGVDHHRLCSEVLACLGQSMYDQHFSESFLEVALDDEVALRAFVWGK